MLIFSTETFSDRNHWSFDSNIEQQSNLAGCNLKTNNNQLNKGGLDQYVRKNILETIKLIANIYSQWYIESIFAELIASNGIIVVGLIYKCIFMFFLLRTDFFSIFPNLLFPPLITALELILWVTSTLTW